MIASGTALKYYSDDENLNGKVETIKLKNNKEVEIKIPNNGGVLLVN